MDLQHRGAACTIFPRLDVGRHYRPSLVKLDNQVKEKRTPRHYDFVCIIYNSTQRIVHLGIRTGEYFTKYVPNKSFRIHILSTCVTAKSLNPVQYYTNITIEVLNNLHFRTKIKIDGTLGSFSSFCSRL